MLALLLCFLAMFSLIGFISHTELAPIAPDINSNFLDRISLDIFLSGPIGIGIFSGSAILLWVLRFRI